MAKDAMVFVIVKMDRMKLGVVSLSNIKMHYYIPILFDSNYSASSLYFHKFISTNTGCSAIAENLLSTITFPSNPTSEICNTMLQLQRLLQTVVNSYTSKEITTATRKPTTENATTMGINETATTTDIKIRIIGRIEKI